MSENEREAMPSDLPKPTKAALAANSAKQTSEHVADSKSLDAIFGVKLDVRVVLGRSRMPISEILNLQKDRLSNLTAASGNLSIS